jgi:hypothetical protein
VQLQESGKHLHAFTNNRVFTFGKCFIELGRVRYDEHRDDLPNFHGSSAAASAGPGGGEPSPVTTAPIPAQILSAKTVFIGNAGGDERRYDDPIFTGGPERAYNEVYAAIRTGGAYELVGTPAEADLVLEIGMFAPALEDDESGRDFLSRTPYDPQFRLAIREPKTNTLLWAFTEHVEWAILPGNRDKNFEATLNKLVVDLQGLARQAAIPPADSTH